MSGINLSDHSLSALTVEKLQYPGSTCTPAWIRELFAAPGSCCWISPARTALQGWERYYQELFDQTSDNSCRDFVYAAQIDSRPAGRMWFGYSCCSKIGNFGNVLTLPEFRRRGVMSAMLEQCLEDFFQSDALLLLCQASQAAADSYLKNGFRRVFDDDSATMMLAKPDAPALDELLHTAYSNSSNAIIRPGRRSDRFDLDKLLPCIPEWRTNWQCRNMLVNFIPDYLSAFQRIKPQDAALSVIESASGFAAGYVYVERLLPDASAVISYIHPGFADYRREMISHAVKVLNTECGKLIDFCSGSLYNAR